MKFLSLIILIYSLLYGKVLANDFSFILNDNLYFFDSTSQDYYKINSINNVYVVSATNDKIFVITNPIEYGRMSYYLHELIKTKNSYNRDTFMLNFISEVANPSLSCGNENNLVFPIAQNVYVFYNHVNKTSRYFSTRLTPYGFVNNMFVFRGYKDVLYCLDTTSLEMFLLDDNGGGLYDMYYQNKGKYFSVYDRPMMFEIYRNTEIYTWDNNKWICHEYDLSPWNPPYPKSIIIRSGLTVSNVSNDILIVGFTLLEGDLESNQKNATMAIVFLELNLKTGQRKPLLRIEKSGGLKLESSIIQWKE